MKKITSKALFFILVLSSFMYTCKKEKHEDLMAQGQLEFTFSGNTLKSSLKSAGADTIAELTSVVFTIEDASGNVIKNSEKAELYNMNGNYISKPISLVKGGYKLTGFLVLDSKNNIVYASPVKGSPKAYLVQAPLPISFNVQLNVVTKLAPEVLSTFESKPEDFGYVTFGFDVVKTFDFLIGVFVYNDSVKNFELTTADISILNGSTVIYKSQLQAKDSIGITNKITLPEQYNDYTLIISKQGYKTFNQIFTKEELKLHLRSADKGPLEVILEKSTLVDGLVALYQFNGNTVDESGNGHNGTTNGTAIYTSDRSGNANGAMDFTNNSSVSATIGRMGSITIATWLKMPAPTTWYPTIVEYLPVDMVLDKGAFFFHILGNIYPAQEQGKLYYGLYNDRSNIQTRDDERTPSPIAYNAWNHLVFTYDSITQVAKMYVNGVLITAKTSANSLYNQNLTRITIGRQFIHNPSKPTNLAGSIDELRIYNRALTLDEIKTLQDL